MLGSPAFKLVRFQTVDCADVWAGLTQLAGLKV